MILYTDIEPFCCEVLRARVADGGLLPGDVWERDVRTLTADELKPYTQVHLFCGIGASPLGLKWARWPSDLSVVTAGFPCTDISVAGEGEGISGDESGLYVEAIRVVDLLRPEYAILENSPALTSRGLGDVLGDLAAIGYDAEWTCFPASAIGAPHKRDRMWIVAYPMRDGMPRLVACRSPRQDGQRWSRSQADLQFIAATAFQPGDRWPQPLIRRVDDGFSNRLDRLHALGNAQVPQCVELIARAILQTESTPERSEA
jgi:site-specific DNA-cytosine methylase